MQVNKCNTNSLWTALHWASHHGDQYTVIELLKNNASPALPDERGYFPMDLAGKFGHREIVEKLISHSLELIKKNSDEQTQKLMVS